MCNTNRTTEFVGSPKVVDVNPHTFKKGVASARINQKTITRYMSNGDNPLMDSEEVGKYPGERNIFLDCKEGTTIKEAQKLFTEKAPKAKIIRILGDEVKDVMSRGQLWALANPDAEVIRNPEAVSKSAFEDRLEIKDQDGKPVAYNGDRQFGANFLDVTGELDPVIDLRGLPEEAKEATKKSCALA